MSRLYYCQGLASTSCPTIEEVERIVSNCVALSGHKSAYVEMICTRGSSPTFSRGPRDGSRLARPTFIVADGYYLK